MNVETIRDEGQKLRYPTGKILGIVDSQTVLDGLARAMENAGFTSMQALSGDEGVSLLERSERFFFSDMEDRVLARHIEELKAGHLISPSRPLPIASTKQSLSRPRTEPVGSFTSAGRR